MKYPGDISAAEYAAMEEGYEQGAVAGRAEQRAMLAHALDGLRTRGGARIEVDGTVHEIRVLMLRSDPDNETNEQTVLSLDDVALLVAAEVAR